MTSTSALIQLHESLTALIKQYINNGLLKMFEYPSYTHHRRVLLYMKVHLGVSEGLGSEGSKD